MALTETDKEYRKKIESMRDDQLLWAAQNDPMTRMMARTGRDLLGVSETPMTRALSRDLALVLQNSLGLENEGVNMMRQMRSGIDQVGVMGQTPSGYSGSLNGYNIAGVQATTLMERGVQNYFFDENGLPRDSTQGLTKSEIGQMTGLMMRRGAGYQFGPQIESEVMTEDRIDELRKQGQKRFESTGSRDLLEEIEKLEPGDTRFSATNNQNQLKRYFEEGAKSISILKDILGGKEIKNLEAQLQTLLGGSLGDFGTRNARIRLEQLKSNAQVHFGGNQMEALAWSARENANLSRRIAGRLGMNPNDPMNQERFGMVASNALREVEMDGMIGGNAQLKNAGVLKESGINIRSRGSQEIQGKISDDLSVYMAQEKEMLALSTLMQREGDALPEEQRQEIQNAVNAISSASTAEEVTRARMNAQETFSSISGRSVGAFVGDRENQSRLIQQLAGEGAELMGRGVGGIHRNRMQSLLRSQYERDTSLDSMYGLEASEAGTVGMALANLTSTQFQDLRTAAEEEGGVENFFQRDEIKSVFGRTNVDTERAQQLISEMSSEEMSAVRGRMNQYRGTDHFVAEGDLYNSARDSLQNYVSRNQSGKAQPDYDIITEFMKGIHGENNLTGAGLISFAEQQGEKLYSFQIDEKTGAINLDEENLNEMTAGVSTSFWETMGVKEGDIPALQEKLESNPRMQRVALKELSNAGASKIFEGEFSYLTEEQTNKTRDILQSTAIERIFSEIAGENIDVGQVNKTDQETQEEYDMRISKKLGSIMGQRYSEEGTRGTINDWIEDEDSYQKFRAAINLGEGLPKASQGILRREITEMAKEEDQKLEAKKDSMSDKDRQNTIERHGRLMELQKQLREGQDGRQREPETVNVEAKTVNIKQQGKGED